MTAHGRILILGHSGFIGRAVEAALRARRPDARIEGLSAPEFDLTDPASPRELADRLGTDLLLVVLSGIKRQWGDTLEIFRKNVDMIANVAAALERKPAGRVVYMSSAAVYGEDIHNLAIREDTPLRARSYYGLSKIASEGILEREEAAGRMGSLLCLRPPTVIGPGDTSKGYGPVGFASAALAGEPITLWGDGMELREFLHVDDLARLTAEAALSDAAGPLNAASGESRTFRDLLDGIEKILGRKLDVKSKPRSKEKADNRFDPSRLRGLFPDFRFTSLEDALAGLCARGAPAKGA